MQNFGKVALFDFDGTLVDSMPVWSEKMLRLLRLQNINPPTNLVPIIATLGDKGTLDYFEKNFELKLTREQMQLEMDAYALPRYEKEIPLKQGAKEFLFYLKGLGIKIGLLTASPHKMFEPALKRLGILELFDFTFSTDDFNLTKSNPQIYLEVAKLLKVSPCEITFFDDNLSAITTAKKAKLKTVAVYDKTSENHSQDLKNTADQYILSFTELLSK